VFAGTVRKARCQAGAVGHAAFCNGRRAYFLEVNCDEKLLWFEDLIDKARIGPCCFPTRDRSDGETWDEQAFAVAECSNPIFCRRRGGGCFGEQLQAETRWGDFAVVAIHQENLHKSDAFPVLTQGENLCSQSIDPKLFSTLFSQRRLKPRASLCGGGVQISHCGGYTQALGVLA